jgi:protein O-GlcNAc transferase
MLLTDIRPAPLQAHYLGYPGMMESPYIDYIIADEVVIPRKNRTHYREKLVCLPNCYLPADNRQEVSSSAPDRRLAGLPETGIVFACFNAPYKINPDVFDVWMNLLRNVDGSVLWLRSDHRDVVRNLRREAEFRGVAPERVVFARRIPEMGDHLSRLRLADLFLDTLPYNAHATACGALWVGLPLVTCIGGAFAGRVGASLLRSVGLPELIAGSLAEYEQLAHSLACNPERLALIKAKLMRNRDTAPLFDTKRFARDLEGAYVATWERQQSGLPPADFAVAPGRELIS